MKAVLITGVSTGIGYSTAKYLKDQGYHVFGSVRTPEDAARMEKELGGGFTPVVFDVRNRNAVFAAADKVKQMMGTHYLRALINNSGISVAGPLQHIDVERFREQQEVNVIGVLNVLQAFLPLIGAVAHKTDKVGKVINISSVGGRLARPFYGPYNASKHAVEGMTDALRRELLDHGIDAVVIEPGPIQSEIYEKAKHDPVLYEGTIYHDLYKEKTKFIEFSQKISIPAIKVARLIHKTIINERPPTRQVIVAKKWFIKLMLMLPDRIVDRMVVSQMKGIIGSK